MILIKLVNNAAGQMVPTTTLTIFNTLRVHYRPHHLYHCATRVDGAVWHAGLPEVHNRKDDGSGHEGMTRQDVGT